MLISITALRTGARRPRSRRFQPPIASTPYELEELAGQFNSMAAN